MIKIFIFTVTCLVYYLIISFLVANFAALTWHWSVRLLYIIIVMLIFNRVNDSDNK